MSASASTVPKRSGGGSGSSASAEPVRGRRRRITGRALALLLVVGALLFAATYPLRAYLNDVRRQCAQIHEAILQTYVAYPVEPALAS